MMKKKPMLSDTIFFAVLVFGMTLGLMGVSTGQAAVFVVDGTVSDGDPGSLRDFIEQANATVGEDTIELRPGRYILKLGQLEVRQDLSIVGSGERKTIIDACGNSRIFFITTAQNLDINVKIEGVTITNGEVKNQNESAKGGGIYNEGKLTLVHSRILGNTIEGTCIDDDYSNDRYFSGGGGIYNEGKLIIRHSKIKNNTAACIDDGLYGDQAYGGGIYNHKDSTLTLIKSNIIGNTVSSETHAYGGGICNNGNNTMITIIHCKVTGNKAKSPNHANGGGINSWGYGMGLAIRGSQIDGNIAEGGNGASGGGISCAGEGVKFTLTRSKIVKNTVIGSSSAAGGGIFNFGNLIIRRSIINKNRIKSKGIARGGGVCNQGYLTIRRSKISMNTAKITSVDSVYGKVNGGGIYSFGYEGKFILNQSKVTYNKAISPTTAEGGGIWVDYVVTYLPKYSHIMGNTPDQLFIRPKP
jgi:hypothetical protein